MRTLVLLGAALLVAGPGAAATLVAANVEIIVPDTHPVPRLPSLGGGSLSAECVGASSSGSAHVSTSCMRGGGGSPPDGN